MGHAAIFGTRTASSALAASAAFLALLLVPARGQAPPSGDRGLPQAARRLPLAFVENRGQWRGPARYAGRRGGMTAHLAPGSVTVQFTGRSPSGGEPLGTTLRLVFEGSNVAAEIEGVEELPGRYHYYFSRDPARWRTDVPGFARVRYPGLYEGVDLLVREEGGHLEYDLRFAPGASLDGIVVRVDGTDAPLRLDGSGDLLLSCPLGEVRQPRPKAWEEGAGGEPRLVPCAFRLEEGNRFAFAVPDRDRARTLVVDPGLLFSTYLGGASDDFATAVAVDATGDTVVAGSSRSLDFPATLGAFDPTADPLHDAFLTRISAGGNSLVFSTFLGGGSADHAEALSLDAAGEVTVTGFTDSLDFPTTPGAFDTDFNTSIPSAALFPDAFLARLSPTGSSLVFSTFLGGVGTDHASSLAVDPAGASTVVGWTASPDFPATAGSYATTYSGTAPTWNEFGDAFVARLPATGTFLVWSTFLGGSGEERGLSVDLDGTGAAVVAGATASADFPTTPGAFDTTYNPGPTFPSPPPSPPLDAFLARVSPLGNSLVASIYLGGALTDVIGDVAVQAGGTATLAGYTESGSFPTTAGAFDTIFGGGDGFVARVDFPLSTLLFSTFLGTGGAPALAVDAGGKVIVAGRAGPAPFPTTPGAFDSTLSGGADAFVALLSSGGGALHYSTLLGGAGGEGASDIALDIEGNATVAGLSRSPDFPTTPGALDTAYGGVFFEDGFLARLDLLPTGAARYGTSLPGCAGPLSIGVTSIPQVGKSTFAFTCAGAPPNGQGLLGLSAAPGPGGFLWIDLPLSVPLAAPADPLGGSEAGVPIPPLPSLAGALAFAQFFWADPCAGFGISTSNALAISLQP